MRRITHQLIPLAILGSIALFPSLSAAQVSPGRYVVGTPLEITDIPVSADIHMFEHETPPGHDDEVYWRPTHNKAVVYYPEDMGHETFPLIVYGHGMRFKMDTCAGTPRNNEEDYKRLDTLLSHLASWGFIVMSVDLSWLTPSVGTGGINDRKYALRDAVNYMVRENSLVGSLFGGRIRTLRIGLMGHSMGADAALSLGASGLLGAGVGAIAAIAPPNQDVPDDVAAFAPTPVLFFQGTRDDFWYGRAAELYRDARPKKHLVTTTDANHFGYTDSICDKWETASGVSGVLVREDQQNIAKAYLSAFFRLYLGSESCDPALNRYLVGTSGFERLEAFATAVLADTGGVDPACVPPPLLEPDRFESPLNNDDRSTATGLAMRETHSLDRRIMVDGEWSHVFATNVSWEANAPDLNLHNSADQDFFRIQLPDLASYSGGNINPPASTTQPLIEHGTLERRAGLSASGERGTDLLIFSGRLDISGADTVYYGHVATDDLGFNNPQSELSMAGDPIVMSYGEHEHGVVGHYHMWAGYRIDVLRVPQPTQVFLTLAQERGIAGMLPCAGGIFPKCMDLSFEREFEANHPHMKPLRDCKADGCPDYFVFLWEGTSAFDVKFTAMPAVSFRLLNLNLKQIAEAGQLQQLPTDGTQQFAAMSLPNDPTVFKQLYVSNLAPGFYMLEVSGSAASYNISFVPPPPAPDSDGDGIVDPFDLCPGNAEDMDGIFDADGCPDPTVKIDIKPGSDKKCFDQDGHGVIPVTIFGNAQIDVRNINPATLSLQGLSARTAGKSGKYVTHYKYVDEDNYLDVVVQFEDSDKWVNSKQGTATLTGFLYDGTGFGGTDAVCIAQGSQRIP